MENRPIVGTTYMIACYVSGVKVDGIGGIDVIIQIADKEISVPLNDWLEYSKPKE